LDAQIGIAKENIVSISNHVCEVDKSIMDMQDNLKLKASVKELRECVKRKHYEEAVSVLGVEIESKTSINFSEALQKQIEVSDVCFFSHRCYLIRI
jgi:hypothetical protein